MTAFIPPTPIPPYKGQIFDAVKPDWNDVIVLEDGPSGGWSGNSRLVDMADPAKRSPFSAYREHHLLNPAYFKPRASHANPEECF